MKFKICHLYPDLLNLYGDRGNIMVMYKRSKWRGIDVEIDEVSLNRKTDLTEYDFIFLGGGSDREQKIITDDLVKYKGGSLLEAVEGGAALLSICGGYQLLGNYYTTHTGESLDGIGLFDIYTKAGKKRLIGNVVLESGFFTDMPTLVGFENHSGKTYLGEKVEPIGKVTVGFGNNGEDFFEGARYKNAFGTYLHGPILPKNSQFADLLIKLSLQKNYGEVHLESLDDSFEIMAHQAVVKRFAEK